MLARLTVATALAFAALPALAQENPRPMDLKEVDPAMVADMFGTWIITDERGKKRCEVVLKANATIGGQEIVVKPGCKKAFPVMDERVITAPSPGHSQTPQSRRQRRGRAQSNLASLSTRLRYSMTIRTLQTIMPERSLQGQELSC